MNEQLPQPKKQPSSSIGKHIISCLETGNIEVSIDQKMQHIWTSLKITIGGLLIRGYRTFKYMLQQQTIIFIKKQSFNTRYLFMKITQNENLPVQSTFFSSFRNCVQLVQKFRRKQLDKYSLLILYGLNYTILQIHNGHQLNNLLKHQGQLTKNKIMQILPVQCYIQQLFAPFYSSQTQILLNEDEQQHKKLKQVMFSYIDTFGQKYKTNYYLGLSKKCLYLLNTLNLLIFQETKANLKLPQPTPVYSQIQSSNWTQFKEGGLKPDRKDLVLSGAGKVLIIDLTFTYNLNMYIEDETYQQEIDKLIAQYNQSHIQTKIKVVKIQNNLTARNVYSYQSKLVRSFSYSPTIS